MTLNLIGLLIKKLPPLDMAWPDEIREMWLNIATRLMVEAEAHSICRLPNGFFSSER